MQEQFKKKKEPSLSAEKLHVTLLLDSAVGCEEECLNSPLILHQQVYRLSHRPCLAS